MSSGTQEPCYSPGHQDGDGPQDRGSHGGDGLIVEGDEGHAKRLLVHLLLLPLVILLQLLLQLRVVLNGLHLPRASEARGGGRARGRSGQRARPLPGTLGGTDPGLTPG